MGLVADILFDQYGRAMDRRDLDRAVAIQAQLEQARAGLGQTGPGQTGPGPTALQPAGSGIPAAPVAGVGGGDAENFLRFAATIKRLGITPSQWTANQRSRKHQALLESPAAQALPVDQQLDAWQGKSAHSRAFGGDTIYNRFGSDPGMVVTPLGEAKRGHQAGLEAQARAGAARNLSSRDVNRSRSAALLRPKPYGSPIERVVDGKRQLMQPMQMPDGSPGFMPVAPPGGGSVGLPAPRGNRGAGTTQAAPARDKMFATALKATKDLLGDEYSRLDQAGRLAAVEERMRDLYPSEFPVDDTPEVGSMIMPDGSKQYWRKGQQVAAPDGTIGVVVGFDDDGMPIVEERHP